MKNALKTGLKLLKWGFQGDVKCVFCRNVVEVRDHLFLVVVIVGQNMEEYYVCVLLRTPPICWEDVVEEGLLQWKKIAFKAYTCRLALGSTVYHLWQNRNALKYDNHPLSEDQLIQKIKWEVRVRLMGKGKFRKTKGNVDICYK